MEQSSDSVGDDIEGDCVERYQMQLLAELDEVAGDGS